MVHDKKMKFPLKVLTILLIIWAFFMSICLAFGLGAKLEYQRLVRNKIQAHESRHHLQKNNKIGYSIIDGSLYKVSTAQRSQLLVEKRELMYKDLEKSTLFTITKYDFSPDNSKILIHAQGAISAEVLFLVECEGGMVTPIDPGAEAMWSDDSKYIAYTSRNADIGPLGLHVYDSESKKEVDLKMPKNVAYMDFSKPHWNDTYTVSADYYLLNAIPQGKVVKKGQITIDLSSSTTSVE